MTKDPNDTQKLSQVAAATQRAEFPEGCSPVQASSSAAVNIGPHAEFRNNSSSGQIPVVNNKLPAGAQESQGWYKVYY